MEHTPPMTRFAWDDAPAVNDFYGRGIERSLLEQWILQEGCQMAGVLGMGGIGKSALVITVMHQVAPAFECVVFRSVRNAPPCQDLLADCLQIFSPRPFSMMPERIDQRLDLLLECFQAHRCLFVLDNLESLLLEQDQEGCYLPNYEDYGKLFRRIVETAHQSCLLLTSRETPAGFAHLESNQPSVRILRLAGLEMDACEQLFAEQEIAGTVYERGRLVDLYEGNPLALKIAVATLIDLFGGQIGPFLEQGEVIFSGIRDLLTEQFMRLPPLEQLLLTWLAIAREPLDLDDLLAMLAFPIPDAQVKKALEVLQKHSLVERGKLPKVYTLQSVVLQYVTETFVERVWTQIQREDLGPLLNYALELAGTKEYVRQAQMRFLVAPIILHLRGVYQHMPAIEELFLRLLDQLRAKDQEAQGYGPANLMVLLRELRGHLRGIDLSQLFIRGAYLQGVEMQDASLAGAMLRDTVFTETVNAAWAVAISRTGQYWAAGSRRGEVRVWREGGKTSHLLWQAHADNTCTLAFSPDERTLATGGGDGVVKLWNLENGVLLWAGWHTDIIRSVAFAPDGRTLASGGNDAKIQIWETISGQSVQTLAGQSGAYALAWSPNGQILASACFDGNVQLWEMRGSEPAACIKVLTGHTNWVVTLAFAPDGTYLASGSWDNTVRLWDMNSEHPCQILTGHTQRVRAVAWSSDRRTLASAGFDATIWLWDVEHSRYRAALHGHTAMIYSLAFTPDNRSLLSSSEDGTLRVWDAESGLCTRIIEGYAVSLYDVAWSPDGHLLASAGSDLLVNIWDVSSGTHLKAWRGHSWTAFGVVWSPDGQVLASSGWDNSIRLWKAATGACFRIVRDPDYNDTVFFGVAWSPDGRLLASGSYIHGVQVWDMVTYTRRWVGHPHQTRISRVAWSPDGMQLASCNDDGDIYLWQASDGMLLAKLQGHRGGVASVAWSPDGRLLASGGGGREGGEVLVWDAVRREVVQALRGLSSRIFAVVWSPGGEILISGDNDGAIRWWKAENGECVRVREGHQGGIQALKICPDGHMLASSGDDSAIRLWDLASGELLKTLRQDRPYERLNIAGTGGLTAAQKITLRTLGAIDCFRQSALRHEN